MAWFHRHPARTCMHAHRSSFSARLPCGEAVAFLSKSCRSLAKSIPRMKTLTPKGPLLVRLHHSGCHAKTLQTGALHCLPCACRSACTRSKRSGLYFGLRASPLALLHLVSVAPNLCDLCSSLPHDGWTISKDVRTILLRRMLLGTNIGESERRWPRSELRKNN